MEKIKILFLCTGNSCRSQMAEGFCHAFKENLMESYSAGIEAHGLNPRTIKVMSEVGIDITNQVSNTIGEFLNIDFDYVVTLCDHAEKNCPNFTQETEKRHLGLKDPVDLAKNATTEEEALEHYRKTRDLIRSFVEDLPNNL